MVAFCFGFTDDAGGSARVGVVASGASVTAAVGSGNEVGVSRVTVRPSDRGGRPDTAEADLSRAMTLITWD